LFLFFFFQAEDGIRDFHVTGVQTCALPIYYYFLASPQAIILSKMLYNFLLMIVFSGICYFFYGIVLGNPIDDQLYFIIAIILGRSEERRVGKECRLRW